MPPRKKAKASAASTPLADAQTTGTQDHDLFNDPWTDDQEIQLLKTMVRWKPTGMHKHFRMVSIHGNMRSHGFAGDDAPHTRIPGIWRKIEKLYDLRALDEREYANAFGEEPDPLDPDDAANMPSFELPEDEYGEMMWQCRFHGPRSAASSSPPLIPTEDDKALFVPDFGLLKDNPHGLLSRKAESVAEATPTPKKSKPTRASRAAATKSGKGAKGQSTAKNSKAQSAASDSEEGEDEDDEDESSPESEEDNTGPSTRRTARSTGKARPAPKRTRKR
ncbi:CT20-domain-containing protein [Byssothecium circinans]|uniref:CT20-domain-containing protein n=1 Tax=Byssothecium circinans TaxID=147558 RepID=A0A6A5T9A9_9PLEO|nr:CT20-domain-containing protein [Byssothecium circinans]